MSVALFKEHLLLQSFQTAVAEPQPLEFVRLPLPANQQVNEGGGDSRSSIFRTTTDKSS